jgi:hypothetical protein
MDRSGPITGLPGSYIPLSPWRLLDTRVSSRGSGSCGTQRLAQPPGHRSGQGVDSDGCRRGAASGVSGVVLNVTVADCGYWGYLTSYPGGAGRPGVSNLNFGPGQTVPNLTAVKTGPGGVVKFYNSSSSSTDVIADVSGYFTA